MFIIILAMAGGFYAAGEGLTRYSLRRGQLHSFELKIARIFSLLTVSLLFAAALSLLFI